MIAAITPVRLRVPVRDWVGSRRRLLGMAAIGVAGALAPRALAAHLRRFPPLISEVRIHSRRPYAGDTPELANLGMAPGRDTATRHVQALRPADVALDVRVTGQGAESEQPSPVAVMSFSSQQLTLPAGRHTSSGLPIPPCPAEDVHPPPERDAGGQADAGPETGSAVARFLGVDAGFGVRTTLPGGHLPMTSARTEAGDVQALHCGGELEPTYSNDVMKGDPSAIR